MAPTTRSTTGRSRPATMLTAAANAAQNVLVGGRTIQRRNGRNGKEARDLALVNGVRSASKVFPGQRPVQGDYQPASDKSNLCSICGRGFKRKKQVKYHMYACVTRNGNPNGAFWDDAWTGRVTQTAPAVTPTAPQAVSPAAAAAVATAGSGSDQSKHEDEDPPAQGLEGEELQGEVSQPQYQGPTAPIQATQAPQAHSRPEPLPLGFPSAAYDPAMRMETQTNRTLIQMLQPWKRWFGQVRGGQPFIDWRFMQLMGELVQRGVLDRNGVYAVDLRYLDMEFRRA